MLTPLYSPGGDGPMRVAGFMSGSGTNLIKILDRQVELQKEPRGSPYKVVVIFSDKPSSNASQIAQRYGTPFIVKDIMAFYREQGHQTKKDLTLRPEFDRQVLALLEPYNVDTVVLAGYMSVVTAPLLKTFSGRIINVHPADLRILKEGKRKYTGDYAVRDAILAGETVVRSSTHIVREEVDGGEILMVSDGLPVGLPADRQGIDGDPLKQQEYRELLNKIVDEHQEQLKQIGDWVILPKTLERLAQGRYALDPKGQVYLDGEHLLL